MDIARQPAQPTASLRSDAILLGAFASIVLVVHFALGNGYGFHRDALQSLDDARHLAWGFTAYPPPSSTPSHSSSAASSPANSAALASRNSSISAQSSPWH